jgi:hypothetical protein
MNPSRISLPVPLRIATGVIWTAMVAYLFGIESIPVILTLAGLSTALFMVTLR